MSTSYRYSRNIEASIIDQFTTWFTADWTGVDCVKTFANVTEDLPTVCIRVGVTEHTKAEIGTDSTYREVQVLIDLFYTSDGQRLDIKDYIVSKVKGGFIYYDYVINNGTVQTKTANGRIRVLNIEDVPIDFDTPKSELDVRDRFRHLVTLNCTLGRIET